MVSLTGAPSHPATKGLLTTKRRGKNNMHSPRRICRAVVIATFVVVAVVTTSFADALNFALIGDVGLGGEKYAVQEEMRSSRAVNEACDLLGGCNFTVIVGDNMYCPNVAECLRESFEKAYKSAGPFFPSIGNHDNWGPQVAYTGHDDRKRWRFPRQYYSFQMPIDETGYTVHIFALDTTDGGLANGGQLAWLENELRRTTARWKILFGHYPTVGSGRHKRVGTVSGLHNLMAKYGVQAYFAGHDHIVEMSTFEGRMLGITGGIVRGGMMWRQMAGVFRKFTLTSPGEYYKFVYDWPIHGFMTAQLSPNTMTVQIWDNSGGVQYECTVTHDWITKANTQPSSKRNDFPDPEYVLNYKLQEKDLPLGPGGGVAFLPDGVERVQETRSVNLSSMDVVVAQPPRNASNSSVSGGNQSSTVTSAPSAPSTTSKSPIVHIDSDKLSRSERSSLPDIKGNPDFGYMVSTECGRPNCSSVADHPTVGESFTVYVTGMDMAPELGHRMFLSGSSMGCALSKETGAQLAGTNVATLKGNTVAFTIPAATTLSSSMAVYVCLSLNGGSTYVKLDRKDSRISGASFIVQAANSTTTPNGGRGTSATTAPSSTSSSAAAAVTTVMGSKPNQTALASDAPLATIAAAASPVPSSSASSSAGIVVFVAVIAAVVGGIALFKTRQEARARQLANTRAQGNRSTRHESSGSHNAAASDESAGLKRGEAEADDLGS